MKFFSCLVASLVAVACAFAGNVEDYASKIATLIEPAKLATLDSRGAKPRSPLNCLDSPITNAEHQKEMKMNCRLPRFASWTWALWFLGAGFIAGCGSTTKVATQTSGNLLQEPVAPQATDLSWAIDDYVRAGIPDPR